MKIAPKPQPGQEVSLENLLTQEAVQSEPSGFSVKEHPFYWQITGVEHRGDIYSVKLAKDMFRDQEFNTIKLMEEEWAACNLQQQKLPDPNARYQVLSAPFYMSIFLALADHKDDELHTNDVGLARDWLVKLLTKESHLVTVTKCYFEPGMVAIPIGNGPFPTPPGPERAIHNIGMPDQYEVIGELGVDTKNLDELPRELAESYCKTLFERTFAQVSQAMDWLTGKPPVPSMYTGYNAVKTGFTFIRNVDGPIIFVASNHPGSSLGAIVQKKQIGARPK